MLTPILGHCLVLSSRIYYASKLLRIMSYISEEFNALHLRKAEKVNNVGYLKKSFSSIENPFKKSAVFMRLLP